jgi:hypothetical protein
MRFRKETIEWKNDSTNRSTKEQVVEFRQRTGYTRATHRHTITRMPLLWGVAHNRTHTMGVGSVRKLQDRETRTMKDVWTDGTEGLKRLIEYTKKIGLFHEI